MCCYTWFSVMCYVALEDLNRCHCQSVGKENVFAFLPCIQRPSLHTKTFYLLRELGLVAERCLCWVCEGMVECQCASSLQCGDSSVHGSRMATLAMLRLQSHCRNVQIYCFGESSLSLGDQRGRPHNWDLGGRDCWGPLKDGVFISYGQLVFSLGHVFRVGCFTCPDAAPAFLPSSLVVVKVEACLWGFEIRLARQEQCLL